MMINLNPATRLADLLKPAPGTAVLEASDDGETLVLSRSSAQTPEEALLLAQKKRIRQLKKQIELLQQKLRRATVRLASIKSGHSGSDTGQAMALSSARAQVMAYSTSLSMAQSALFQAQSGTLA